jgi:hypothetical protein
MAGGVDEDDPDPDLVAADDAYLDAVASADPDDPELDLLTRMLAAWRNAARGR